MIGYIDVGGGMRAVYGAGVLDRFIDDGIEFPYYIGVSAGAANIISFLGGHRERTLRFYGKYSARPEYMGVKNLLKTKSYLNLDYIYTTLTNEDGEDPLNYDTVKSKSCKFFMVAANAETGKTVYFDFDKMERNNYYQLRASCCIPIVCKPIEHKGTMYFDGGIVDPVPIRKAFDDGCEKVIITLTRPLNDKKKNRFDIKLVDLLLKEYPASAKLLRESSNKYNDDIDYICRLEKEGKVLILAPDDCCGVNTLTRDEKTTKALYNKGYADAEKIKSFLTKDDFCECCTKEKNH